MTSIGELLEKVRNDAEVDLSGVDLTEERSRLIADIMKKNQNLAAVYVYPRPLEGQETRTNDVTEPYKVSDKVLCNLANGMWGKNFVYTDMIDTLHFRNPPKYSSDPDGAVLRDKSFPSAAWRVFYLKNDNREAAIPIIRKLIGGSPLNQQEIKDANESINGIAFMLKQAKAKDGFAIADPEERKRILDLIPPGPNGLSGKHSARKWTDHGFGVTKY